MKYPDHPLCCIHLDNSHNRERCQVSGCTCERGDFELQRQASLLRHPSRGRRANVNALNADQLPPAVLAETVATTPRGTPLQVTAPVDPTAYPGEVDPGAVYRAADKVDLTPPVVMTPERTTPRETQDMLTEAAEHWRWRLTYGEGGTVDLELNTAVFDESDPEVFEDSMTEIRDVCRQLSTAALEAVPSRDD